MAVHPHWGSTDQRRRRAEAEARSLEHVRERGIPAFDPCDRLTVRQLTALRHIAGGLTTVETAERLGIAHRSLHELLRCAYARLGIRGDSPGKAARACYLLGLRDGKP